MMYFSLFQSLPFVVLDFQLKEKICFSTKEVWFSRKVVWDPGTPDIAAVCIRVSIFSCSRFLSHLYSGARPNILKAIF